MAENLILGRPGQFYKDSQQAYEEDVAPRARAALSSGSAQQAVQPVQQQAAPSVSSLLDGLVGSGSSTQQPSASGSTDEPPRQSVSSLLGELAGTVSQQAETQTTPTRARSSDTGRGFSAAIDQTPALAKGMVGLIGATGEQAFGEGGIFSGLKRYGLEGYQAGMREIAERAEDSDSFSNAWEMAKQGDLGALVDWAQYGLGYVGGSILETVATAALGGAVGTAIGGPAAPATGVAGAVTGVAAKDATKSVARNLIESMVAKEAAKVAEKRGVKEVTEDVTREATRNVASRIGSTAALAASGISKSAGGIYGEAEEQAASEGRELDAGDIARIWGSGVVAGLSEVVVDRLGLDVAAGRIKLPAGMSQSRPGAALIGMSAGIGIEGGQELFQTAVERFGAAKPLTGEEAMREYIDSFALGALGGGTVGGLTGALRAGKQTPERFNQIIAEAEQELQSDDGRQQLFDSMIEDERIGPILRANGIESGSDPRFQSVITRTLATQRMLAQLETPSADQVEQTRKQREADVRAAFGDTASTGTGVATGANMPVIQRESVIPDEQNRDLLPADGVAPQVATLPDGAGERAGTVAMAPEDIVAAQQGFQLMPAFDMGGDSVPNRFVSAAQAETFLYGPKDKQTGQRTGGYASQLVDMEFQIRRGQRSKEAGGGAFYFIEGRQRPPGQPALPSTNVQQPSGSTADIPGTRATRSAPRNPTAEDLVDRGDGVMVPRSQIPRVPEQRSQQPVRAPELRGPAPQLPAPAAAPTAQQTQTEAGGVRALPAPTATATAPATVTPEPDSQESVPVSQQDQGAAAAPAGAGATQPSPAAPSMTFEEATAALYKAQNKTSRLRRAADKAENEFEAGDPRLVAAIKRLRAAEADESRALQVAADLAPNKRVASQLGQPKAAAGGKNQRSSLLIRDPFRYFLGHHGVKNEVGSEFLPSAKERSRVMIPGLGRMFRETGKNIDELTLLAIEEGFLPQGATEQQMYALMERSIGRKEPIFPFYGEDADAFVENEITRIQSMSELDAETQAQAESVVIDGETDEYAIAEREAIQAMDRASDDVINELLDGVELFGPSNVSTEAMMRSLGFTEQEIANEIQGRQESREAGTGQKAVEAQASGQVQTDTAAGSQAGTQQAAKPAKPAKRKVTVEEKLKAKAKADKEAKAGIFTKEDLKAIKEADKQIEASERSVTKEVLANEWEEYGYGTPNYVPFSELSKQAQADWRLAVVDGYASVSTFDVVLKNHLDAERVKKQNSRIRAARKSDPDLDAAFRVNPNPKGMTAERVGAVYDKLTASWSKLPPVQIVQSESELPAGILAEIQRADISGKVPGVYSQNTGRIFLIADNLSDATDVIVTVAHEITGHFGLRRLLGDSYTKTMRDIFKGNAEVRRRAAAMMEREGLGQDIAVEEVLADMAEENAKLGLEGKPIPDGNKTALQRIFAAIRKWMRETLGVSIVTERDLRDLVANARRYVIEGDIEPGDVSAMAPATAMRQTGVPTFFSALERGFRKAKMESMPANQWKTWLQSNKGQLGIKDAEIEWTGINDFLDLKGKEKLTKDEVLNFVGANRIRLNDIILSGPGEYITDSELRSRYIEMYEDSDEGMPNDPRFMDRDELLNELGLWSEQTGTKHNNRGLTLPGGREYVELIVTEPSSKTQPYKRSDTVHFGDVAGGKHIGWLRMNVRDDASGKPTLFIEEIQSQRAQDARQKGILTQKDVKATRDREAKIDALNRELQEVNTEMGARPDADARFVELAERQRQIIVELGQLSIERDRAPTGTVPEAPFIDDTKAWVGLLVKRAIAYAQENGIDQIAWTKGDQQNERYKLSKFVDTIAYIKSKQTGNITISGNKDGREVFNKDVPPGELESVVGKDMAEQINNNVGLEIDNEVETSGIIEGANLEVGGDGMREFYDKMVPQVAGSIIKKFGGKVEVLEIGNRGSDGPFFVDAKGQSAADTIREYATYREAKAVADTIPGATVINKNYNATEFSQQLGFVIPEQLAAVLQTDGLPLFRRKDFEEQFSDLDPKVREMAMNKAAPKPPTIRERLEALKPGMWTRVVQGTFDRFRPVRDIDEKAYMMLRMSNSVQDGAVTGLLHYGHVFNNDGALDVKEGTKGLLEVLKPLGAEVDRFMLWIAANRAEQLSKQERERFFKPEEIAALKRLNAGSTKDGKARAAMYAEALREMNELNRSVLTVAKDAGLIDEAGFKKFSADIWYIPFYRQMEEDGSLSAAMTSTGSVGQYFSKKLKGSDRPLNDLVENVILNWSHILSASMKNQAANETLRVAGQLGDIVTRIEPIDAERGRTKAGEIVRLKGTVKVMEDGKEVRYQIDDEFLLTAVAAATSFDNSGFFTNVLRQFKTTFTRFISLSPTFKVNNLIRDSIQSIGLTQLNYNPVKNVIEGYSAYRRDDRASALAGGGLFAMGNAFDGNMAENVKRLVKKGVDIEDVMTSQEKAVRWLKKNVWDRYDEVSDAMENANRLALYRQLRAKGASHLEAAYAARDLQDFSLQGSFVAVRWLSSVVPYFNARLQGMYKLGRDGIDPVVAALSGKADDSQRKKAAKFSMVLGAVTTFGLLLYLSQKDDEDWKKREEWEKDAFFWFKIPGTDKAIRIPRPFEMGAVAAVVERLTEQMVDDSVEGSVFAKRLTSIIMDNLAMNPMPQLFRPIWDVASNKDGFTGRPIESMGMERLSPENRISQSTSAAGVAMGTINSMFADFVQTATGGGVSADKITLSPIQYDYMLRGYLGWLGAVIQTTSNVATAPFTPGESSRFERIDDVLLVGNYIRTATPSQSKYVTGFYESAKLSATAASDMQHFINSGQLEKAMEIAADKGDLIAFNRAYTKASNLMSTISQQIRAVERDTTLTGGAKRDEIERLTQMRTEIAKNLQELRQASRRE